MTMTNYLTQCNTQPTSWVGVAQAYLKGPASTVFLSVSYMVAVQTNENVGKLCVSSGTVCRLSKETEQSSI